MSVNKVILLGRVGGDAEISYTSSGLSVSKFSLATSEKWTDKKGEKHERTEWSNIAAFGKLAEICGQYVRKGTQVYVEGKLSTSNWEKDGVKHYRTEILIDKLELLSGSSSASQEKEELKEAVEKVEKTFKQQVEPAYTVDSIPF